MGTDARSPKARHRFGFSGPVTRPENNRISADDILDSLTRQAELRQKLGEKDQVRLEEIAETEDLSRFQSFSPDPTSDFIPSKRGSFAHLAFVPMLLAGLVVVWLYGSTLNPFDLASLSGVVQKSGVGSIFANQGRFLIIALTAMIGAFWIRQRRRRLGVSLVSG